MHEKRITWRFSFSYAEVQLSELINEVAQKCFICLKVIGRYYLESKCEKFTYHLKTIFLYTLEKTQLELWADNNIEKGFKKLLDELLQTLSENVVLTSGSVTLICMKELKVKVWKVYIELL